MWEATDALVIAGADTAKRPPDDGDALTTSECRMIQKYRILGKKGEGSFAEVMACQNLRDGQLYACKRLKKHFTSVEQALSLTEVRALRRLSPHVNIVHLHDIIFDKKSGRLALIFELMDLNMHELLKARKKPLPEFRVKNYMYQLLKSLDHIHRQGIFHRDVKPENLLIRDNLLKLADFGSCRGMYTKRPYTEYISTRWYRPPECLLTSGYYSYKMDMWASGCVFFEALTNLPLFPGSSEIDQLAKIHGILGTPRPTVLAKLRRHRKPTRVDFTFQMTSGVGVATLCPQASGEAHQLLSWLCAYDEDERPSARQALRHPYFMDIRLAEKYQSGRKGAPLSTGGKRTSKDLKVSPVSPRSGHVSRAEATAFEAQHEAKKHRSEQTFLLPVLEVKGQGVGQKDADSGSSVTSHVRMGHVTLHLPSIAAKSGRRKGRVNVDLYGHVSQLPPIQKPWRP